MSIWPRSRVANTRRIAPTRATLPITAFRLAAIAPSMRCGPMRPRLNGWRGSRITSPSTPTVSTRSANRRRRPGFGGSGRASQLLCSGRRRQENEMDQPTESKNKALVLEAFDTLFNKRDYAAAERFWSNGMSVPVKVVVVYHSGYGHTVKIAEAVARGAAAINGASVELVPADEAPSRWDILDGADAIIMGAPTYMGSLSAQFKAFMDATSNIQYVQKRWEGNVAAGCTNGPTACR